MPTYQHEVPLHMVRQCPQLAVEILQAATGVPVPEHDQVVSASENVSTLHPAELTCDGAVLASREGKKVLGIVVESQRKEDDGKYWSWPAYLATFRHQNKCDVELLVFCNDRKSAQDMDVPIVLGPTGSYIHPVVVTPADLPPITDPDVAGRHPELAILTAPAHADSPAGTDVLRAVSRAFGVVGRDDGQLYYDYVMSLLSGAARKILEEIVTIEGYQWQSDFALKHIAEGEARGRAEGKAEAKAEAILSVLQEREVRVSDETRDRIMGCTDPEQLQLWLVRAVTAESAEELFD
jgi:hypothetical protein